MRNDQCNRTTRKGGETESEGWTVSPATRSVPTVRARGEVITWSPFGPPPVSDLPRPELSVFPDRKVAPLTPSPRSSPQELSGAFEGRGHNPGTSDGSGGQRLASWGGSRRSPPRPDSWAPTFPPASWVKPGPERPPPSPPPLQGTSGSRSRTLPEHPVGSHKRSVRTPVLRVGATAHVRTGTRGRARGRGGEPAGEAGPRPSPARLGRSLVVPDADRVSEGAGRREAGRARLGGGGSLLPGGRGRRHLKDGDEPAGTQGLPQGRSAAGPSVEAPSSPPGSRTLHGRGVGGAQTRPG